MQKEYVKMLSEALHKTVIMGNWQIFSKKNFQLFIHHKKILKVTQLQFKIICRSRVLEKNIPLWYIIIPPPPTHPPPPSANWVNVISDFLSDF